MLFGVKLVQFLLGPAGKVILLGVAFVGWTLYQRHDATQTCEAAELREELIESQRQLAIAEKIAEDARGRANQTEQEMTQIGIQYEELQRKLQAAPDTACPIDPDTRDRLLKIR